MWWNYSSNSLEPLKNILSQNKNTKLNIPKVEKQVKLVVDSVTLWNSKKTWKKELDNVINIDEKEIQIFWKVFYKIEWKYFIDKKWNILKDTDWEIIEDFDWKMNINKKKYWQVIWKENWDYIIDKDFKKIKDNTWEIIKFFYDEKIKFFWKTYLLVEWEKTWFYTVNIDENFKKFTDKDKEIIIDFFWKVNFFWKTYLLVKWKKMWNYVIDENFNKIKDTDWEIIEDFKKRIKIFWKICWEIKWKKTWNYIIDENFNKIKDIYWKAIKFFWEEVEIFWKKYLKVGKCDSVYYLDENLSELKGSYWKIIWDIIPKKNIDFFWNKYIWIMWIIRWKEQFYFIDQNFNIIEQTEITTKEEIISEIQQIFENNTTFWYKLNLIQNIDKYLSSFNNISNPKYIEFLKEQKSKIKQLLLENISIIKNKLKNLSKDYEEVKTIISIIENQDYKQVERVYTTIYKLFSQIDYQEQLKKIVNMSDIDFNLLKPENIKKIKSLNIEFSEWYYDENIYNEYYKTYLENPYNKLKLINSWIKEIDISNWFSSYGLGKIIRIDSKYNPNLDKLKNIISELGSSYKKQIKLKEIQEKILKIIEIYNQNSKIKIELWEDILDLKYLDSNHFTIEKYITKLQEDLKNKENQEILNFLNINKIVINSKKTKIIKETFYININKSFLKKLQEEYIKEQLKD